MTTIQPSNGGNEAAQPAPPTISSAIMRGIMMYMFMTVAQRFAVQQGFITDPTIPQKVASTSATNVQNAAGNGNGNSPMKPQGVGVNPASMNVASFNGKNGVPSCIWKSRTLLDLHVYITDEEDFDPLTGCLPDMNGNTVKNNILSEYHELDLELSSVDSNKNYRNGNITVPLSKSVQFNETNVYAHVCLLKQKRTQALAQAQGKDDHPSGNENDVEVYHKALSLTKYKRRKKVRDEKNLLSTEDDANDAPAIIPEDASPLTKASAEKKEEAVLLYFKPSLTLQLVDMASMPPFPSKNKIPQSISKHIDWVNVTDIDTDGSTSTGTRTEMYYPLLYSSEFWIKNDALVEVNDTIHEVDLEITFENVKVWKWQLMSQMEETWRRQAETAGDDDAGTDMFRTMLLETNPILLAVTAIISVLHTLFDMLAFKNDIKFFKNKKSMHGLSLRTMVVNTIFQVIILLYLLDNETSFMVLMSNGMGVAIEAWKISKAVKISLFDKDGNVAIAWKETETYTSSKTKEYDEIATDHLMFVTMPLVCGYGLYSLFYQRHKGWYSWIINTLVGFIYMFGFVMMTPQLFINYKLQSVAHLNWRTMTYKSINTFIDDLFAFVIKMPLMHRLACLRDDVIFLIFCYQKYKYRTDYTRVNEFGQCEEPTGEMLEEMKEEKDPQSDDGELKVSAEKKVRRGARQKIS